MKRTSLCAFAAAVALVMLAPMGAFAQATGRLTGQVLDPSGATVEGATVSLFLADGKELLLLHQEQRRLMLQRLRQGNSTQNHTHMRFQRVAIQPPLDRCRFHRVGTSELQGHALLIRDQDGSEIPAPTCRLMQRKES